MLGLQLRLRRIFRCLRRSPVFIGFPRPPPLRVRLRRTRTFSRSRPRQLRSPRHDRIMPVIMRHGLLASCLLFTVKEK